MKGGFIYTPKDERDYPICMAYEDAEDIEIPEEFKVSYQPPFEDQGTVGSCVSQTISNIMEVMIHNMLKSPKIREWIAKINEREGIAEKLSEDKHIDISIGFTYGNRYRYFGEGMTGYEACDNLCKDGVIAAVIFENLSEVPDVIQAVRKFKEENPDWKDYTIIPLEYIRTSNKNNVKKFMMKYDIPVMTVSEVSKFYYGSGYHAMPLFKWIGDVAYMQNSWGEDHKAKIVKLKFDDIKEFWCIVPFVPAEFCDVETAHWAYDEIMKCVSDGTMLGYPDKTFRPDKEITRAEMAVMMYRILKGEKKI